MPPPVDRRIVSSALWGVVGALCFVVLVLGYRLLGGAAVDPAVMGAVTGVVGVSAAGITYVVERKVENRSP